MTTTTILTLIIGLISIVLSFVLGRHSVSRKVKKIKRKVKKAKKAKVVKEKKTKATRKKKKVFIADAAALAGFEKEYEEAAKNNNPELLYKGMVKA